MDVTIKYWRLSATVLKRTDAMLHFPIQYTVGRITAISRRRATLPWQQKDIADKNGISTSKKEQVHRGNSLPNIGNAYEKALKYPQHCKEGCHNFLGNPALSNADRKTAHIKADADCRQYDDKTFHDRHLPHPL